MAVLGGPDIVEDGLVLYLDAANRRSYPGSGTTWFDLSGNGNNGTLTNGPTFNSENGGSISFDGVNDYVTIPYSGNTENTYTFSITIKSNTMNSVSFNRQTIFGLSQDGNAAYRQFDVEIWANTGSGFRGDGGPSEGPNFSSYGWSLDRDANDNNVYTVVITSTYHRMYLNGRLKTTINNSRTAPFNSIVLATRFGGNIWNGVGYNFSMYDRELSATEILQNYNVTRSRFGI